MTTASMLQTVLVGRTWVTVKQVHIYNLLLFEELTGKLQYFFPKNLISNIAILYPILKPVVMLADHEQYDWMSINCAKTCGTCDEDTAEPTEVTQETG